MINAQAQPSYTNNNYKSKDTNVNTNKIKCINDNININGINSGDVNAGNKGVTEGNLGAYSSDSRKGYYDDNKKAFDCSVSNKNTNTNIVSTGGGGSGNQTVPPGPPEPTTATLTVKKQVFGCDRIILIPGGIAMNCQTLQNNSPDWVDCDNISISNSIFCQSAPENIFDIEVNASNIQQISQFEGSEQGTTIQNLEPGTYTVNEIKNETSFTN